MAFVNVGKHYILLKGRRAGEKVTVTKVIDDRIVVVKTEKGKERKASAIHLRPA